MAKIACEICGLDNFQDIQECEKHEVTCDSTIEFKCMMCQETTRYKKREYDIAHQCFKFITLGQYGSQFDGEVIEIDLCDSCIGLLLKKANKT